MSLQSAAAPAAASSTTRPSMVAAHHPIYGDASVVILAPTARPKPHEGEVLVAVHASSVNYGDQVMLTGRPWLVRLVFGLRRPKRRLLGIDVAGVVAAVGPGVTDFAPGDRVFGQSEGAWAELATVPAKALAHLPDGVPFAAGGAVPLAGMTALQGLRDHGRLRAGERVLINGASGGVGHLALQVAKALGAHVTAVVSARNVAQARALGADVVVDYTRQDFTATDARYDLILDVAGSQPLRACRRLLRAGGRYVSTVGNLRFLLKLVVARLFWRNLGFFNQRADAADLHTLAGWLADGRLRPVVERSYPLDKVADALAAFAHGPNGAKTLIVR
ncbi:MAG: NAD(P)-dependent alcohol dehydrogenase [Myxococcales bacterium]|nr:NAD(P)-dependent alcohol dehydrogenase [Myxococcales bacterium]